MLQKLKQKHEKDYQESQKQVSHLQVPPDGGTPRRNSRRTPRAAAGNGLSGINEATSMVTSYFDPGTKLIYAIGAVVGLIGGIKVYSKWSSGDPDTSKTAASWFGACIFLIVAATILRSFFL